MLLYLEQKTDHWIDQQRQLRRIQIRVASEPNDEWRIVEREGFDQCLAACGLRARRLEL